MRLELPLPSTAPPLTRVPAAITSGPVKVLLAASVRIPGPVLVKPPAPLITPSSCRFAVEEVTSIVPIPPVRLNVWLFAVVALAMVPVTPV